MAVPFAPLLLLWWVGLSAGFVPRAMPPSLPLRHARSSASTVARTDKTVALSASFHGEGDESSPVALSGAWKLCSQDEDAEDVDAIVQLSPEGTFSTPVGSATPLQGRWSVDDYELTIAVYGIAKTVRCWYVGTIDEEGTTVHGFIGHGAIDPEWTGKFTLSQLLAPLEKKKSCARQPHAMFEYSQFIGRWWITTNRPVCKRKPPSEEDKMMQELRLMQV